MRDGDTTLQVLCRCSAVIVGAALAAASMGAVVSANRLRRWRRAERALAFLGVPVPLRIQPGTVVVVHDREDLRLVGALLPLVGPTGSITLTSESPTGAELVCVRWRAALASDLAELHASLGGLAPTVLIGIPRRAVLELSSTVSVLSEWGYRVHRVARRTPFRRGDREWLAATSDRRIGLARQRELADDGSSRPVGAVTC